VELCVRDTGHGITPALQGRIFDPYFTTKAQGKGTGMGLAVVHGIVKSHGGTILVESLPGQGTCFRILFPRTEGVAKKTPQSQEKLPMGHESILFVDDEPFLVDLGQQMLTRLGYKVTSCVNALEALEKIRQAPSGFDLVITDMTMPHMTGEELAERIAALRPDLPIILCTGYSEHMLTEKASRLGLAGFVKKPITINELACAIRNVLDLPCRHNQTAATPPRLRVIAND
jgi:CheY-like chemotaxis protein